MSAQLRVNFIRNLCPSQTNNEGQNQDWDIVVPNARIRHFVFPEFVTIETWSTDYRFEFSADDSAPCKDDGERLADFAGTYPVTTFHWGGVRLNRFVQLIHHFPAWCCVTLPLSETISETYYFKLDESSSEDDCNDCRITNQPIETVTMMKYRFQFNTKGQSAAEHFDPQYCVLTLFVTYCIDHDQFAIDHVRSNLTLQKEGLSSNDEWIDGSA
jgi:hypothetical protein